MAVKTQEQLKFKNVNFISLNYNCSQQYNDEEIHLEVIPYLFLKDGDIDSALSFEVIMSVRVEAEGSFSIETTAVGTFTIGEDASQDYRKIFMNQNAPAIMFPYVRSFISTITASFGQATGTIILPAQRFSGSLELKSTNSPLDLDSPFLT